MQFQIDFDHGDTVIGWVLPDNPGSRPTLSASLSGGSSITFEANVFRPDLKEIGHNTGMVGFRIDTSMLPGLTAAADLQIRDEDQGILIFRRFDETRHIASKVMRFELPAMPQVALEAAFVKRFAAPYGAVERFPYDTLFSVINCSWTTSHYLSGRPYFTRHFQLLRDRGFKTLVLLRNPIEELAERLVFLKFAISGKRPDFVDHHLTGLAPLLELVGRIDLADQNSIASALNGLNEKEREAISNPFVRTLACSADEIAQPIHVSAALENLANMDVIGLYDRFDHFKRDVAEVTGTDIIGTAKLASISSVPEIASKLEKLRSVHRLLALDIKLYRFVVEAIEKL